MIEGKNALITGGTDGIGAAAARELIRRGVNVTVVGRSQSKAESLVRDADNSGARGRLTAICSDLSLMTNVRDLSSQVANEVGQLDFVIGAAGILISRKEFTVEGIELDFAVSYLSRFVLLESLSLNGALKRETRFINVAASDPKVPKFAQMEFNDLKAVLARTGMKSHGQAQLANDLLTAQAANRYGVTAIGYGPGSVDTSIRREVPQLLVSLMKPFFARTTRNSSEVGYQLAEILASDKLTLGGTHFFNKFGEFTMDEFIANPTRQAQLLDASLQLQEMALGN